MKAILWKEWRENGRWGVLAFVGVAIALAYTVSTANSVQNYGLIDKCAAAWNAAYQVMTFACPLIAAALGFAQVMPELRRDQWAFLVHRPVSWTVIFGGKAIVGLALALAATGLPFLLFTLWAATPGAVAAPFDARLTLPGVASLLTILPCYFAGMLTALRPARWYGSRALALPAVIAAVLLTISLPEFWDAALAALLFGLVLTLAAWGSFLTRGQYSGQPRSAKIGLGVTLFAGTVVAAITLIGLTAALIAALLPQTPNDGSYTYYSISANGRILRITESYGQQHLTATDLNGKTVTLPKDSRNGSYTTNSLQIASLVAPENNVSSYEVSGSGAAYRNTMRLVVPLGTSVDNSGQVSWYYVPRERRALGYQQKTRRLAGYLGPAGLSPPSDADAPHFEAPYPLRRPWDNGSSSIFRFPQTVYWVDPTVPAVTRIYAARQPGEIQGACVTSGQYAVGLSVVASAAVVVATDSFHAYTPGGTPLFTLPREHDPARYGNVSAAMTPDRKHFFFWYNVSSTKGLPHGSRLPSYVTEVTSAGAVQNRYTLPPLPEDRGTPSPISEGAFGLLAPPLATLAFVSYLEIGHRAGSAAINDMRDELYSPNTLPMWHLFLICSLVSGLLSAALAWLAARRCVLSVRDRWLWAGGVFWLGPYGLLTLLALREWPARVPCPHCGRLRSVNREQCEHCGAAFERPRPDGTEIFDSAAEEIPTEAGL